MKQTKARLVERIEVLENQLNDSRAIASDQMAKRRDAEAKLGRTLKELEVANNALQAQTNMALLIEQLRSKCDRLSKETVELDRKAKAYCFAGNEIIASCFDNLAERFYAEMELREVKEVEPTYTIENYYNEPNQS